MPKPMSNALREILETTTRRCKGCGITRPALSFYEQDDLGRLNRYRHCAECRAGGPRLEKKRASKPKKRERRSSRAAESVRTGISMKAAASRLGVSRCWLTKMAKSGALKAAKVNGGYDIPLSSLEDETFTAHLDRLKNMPRKGNPKKQTMARKPRKQTPNPRRSGLEVLRKAVSAEPPKVLPVSASDVDAALERMTFYCPELRARLTPEQCRENRRRRASSWGWEGADSRNPTCVRCVAWGERIAEYEERAKGRAA